MSDQFKLGKRVKVLCGMWKDATATISCLADPAVAPKWIGTMLHVNGITWTTWYQPHEVQVL